MRLEFTALGRPVPCARARVLSGGWAYTPKNTTDWQSTVAVNALRAMTIWDWPRHTEGPFHVTIDVYRDVDRGDIDNHAKNILDAMTKAGVYKDDRFVRSLLVRLHIDRKAPRVEVICIPLHNAHKEKA